MAMRPLLPLVFVALAGCGGGTSPKPADPNSVAATVNAWGLHQEYKDNAIAADTKYAGKNVKVTGTLERIESDGAGYYLGLCKPTQAPLSQAVYERLTPEEKKKFHDGYPPGMRAYVAPTAKEQFASAKTGSSVAIVGRVKGRQADPAADGGFVVVLEGCVPAPAK